MDTTTISQDHVTLNFTDDDDLARKCATIARNRGWICIAPNDAVWVTPSQICASEGIPPATLSKRLHNRRAPRYPRVISDGGRITRFVMTQELRAFLDSFGEQMVNKS